MLELRKGRADHIIRSLAEKPGQATEEKMKAASAPGLSTHLRAQRWGRPDRIEPTGGWLGARGQQVPVKREPGACGEETGTKDDYISLNIVRA